MQIQQENVTISTQGRCLLNITKEIEHLVNKTNTTHGICQIFLKHTSASLILCENSDPAVRHDLEAFMDRLVPDGDKLFTHNEEGPDDMPAHIRTILTQNSLMIPITAGKLALGTWQGIFLWEHRLVPHQRQLVITVLGQ